MKIRSITAIVVAVELATMLAGCGGGTTSAPSTVTQTVYKEVTPSASATVTVPNATVPQQPTPKYEIIGKRIVRSDNAPYYYVAIEPVDLSNDTFKQNVKLVLDSLAKTDGGPNFSVEIYDDKDIANTAYYSDTHPLQLPLDELKAFWDQQEQHLVANYVGGWDINYAHSSTADDAYTITWFPSAGSPHPVVGKYSSIPQQWKPSP